MMPPLFFPAGDSRMEGGSGGSSCVDDAAAALPGVTYQPASAETPAGSKREGQKRHMHARGQWPHGFAEGSFDAQFVADEIVLI